MAAGYIVRGQCVDVAAAKNLFYSYYEAASTVSGLDTYMTLPLYSSGSDAWTLMTYKNGTLVRATTMGNPYFPSCDTTSGFFDGLQVGWGVALAMITVYVIRRAYR